jgi:arylsulfatase A-like enzyme
MSSRPMNLLIFGIDSLRADHMSCYGYPRLTTPHSDRLASQGVLFDNCYSAYIPTTPAYTSIMTGMDVMRHEMVALGPKGPIDPGIRLLPELLREAGYTSVRVGFGGDFFRGFDRILGYDEGWYAWQDRPARKAERLNDVTIPAMEELIAAGQPWMLFLRHMDPHAPYLPPSPYDGLFYKKDPTQPGLDMTPVRDFPNFCDFHLSWMPEGIEDANHPIAMYDGALAYMDACIQQILTRLDELGQRDNTLVVYTADHGETLYDHGCYFDHHGLYEPTLHVPLIIRFPDGRGAGTRVPGFVLHEDLVPSLLEVLGQGGLAERERMDGRSWVPLIQGERPNNHTEFYITECTWMRKRGWRTPQWKLIDALEPDFHGKPAVELYNLLDDPTEQDNLADREPRIVQCLKDRMTAWVEKRLSETGKPDPILQYQIGTGPRIGSIAVAKKLQDR